MSRSKRPTDGRGSDNWPSQHDPYAPGAPHYDQNYRPPAPQQPSHDAHPAPHDQNGYGASYQYPSYGDPNQPGHHTTALPDFGTPRYDPAGAHQTGAPDPQHVPSYQHETPQGFQPVQPPEPYQGFTQSEPTLRGPSYEPEHTPAYAQPAPAPQYDPAGFYPNGGQQYAPQQPDTGRNPFDLGSYAPSQDSYPAQDGYPQDGYANPAAQTAWPTQPPAGAEQAYYPEHAVAQPNPGGALAPRDLDDYDGDYEDDEYDYEDEDEPRSWTRTFMIAGGALIGAVVVGGGLAYGYATFLAPSGKSNNPLIRSSGTPAKVAPSDPGGTKFANKDSKLLGRLDKGRQAPDGYKRVKPVSTLVVRRDGTLVQAPPAQPAKPEKSAEPAPSQETPTNTGTRVAIPGMTIVGAPATPEPAQPAPQVSAPAAAPAQAKPVRAASVPLPLKNRWIDRSIPIRAEPAPQPRTPTPAPTAAGYVAVLASKTTRMEALAAFADLRSRYGQALQGRAPEIQSADLSSRGLGMMYRVVVGPPGSRDAATGVCTRLKAAGYNGCWVKAY